jgi:hypothetical protein
MASTRLEKTFTASNRKTFTISTWIKRSGLTANNCIYGAGTNDSTDRDYLSFLADSGEEDKLYFNAKVSSSVVAQFYTNRRFRDTSGWYHIVLAFDTTQATDTNRMKLYVNGEQQTFQSQTYPSQNQDMNTNNTVHKIGSTIGNNYYFDGSMSHFHFIDGTAYTASTFGSTDSVTGEWKINTSPSVTYGTNGFFILKDGNSVTDQSGNSNNFTVGGGTLTNTEDCPSNVYATWNNLNRTTSAGIQANGIANGNTYLATATSNGTYSFGSTLALKGTGKFYMEFKISQTGTYMGVGIAETEALTTMLNAGAVGKFSDNAKGWSYKHTGKKENGGSEANYGNTYTANDYIGLAYNNGTIWFSKNGTWQNSATISEINAGTTTNSAFTGLDTSKDYFIMFDGYNDSIIDMNAGNGCFRTTEISSPNNPTSGDTGAKFKYTVPTGYQPLSTKGLNQ